MSAARISLPQVVRYSNPDSPLAGRYVIERELGVGGMAFVFAARDLKHDRSVAVKVMRAEFALSLSVERFTREIQIAAGLTHPNILPVHDSGAIDELLYYVMPLVEGETLVDRIDREVRLPIDDAIRITREVAAALQYAHSRGIIHRDVKPGNVLLPGGVAVVADFGLARAMQHDESSARLTQMGVGVGTPTYMSPEQGAGERNVGAQADQYSLACMAYEMLAGRPPFTGESYQKLLAQHVTEPPVPLRQLRPEIPVEVEAAIARALEKEPADRFATVEDFAQALVGGPRSTAAWRVRSAAWGSALTHRRVLVSIVAAIVLIAVATTRKMTARAFVAPPLDSNLVAVAPFQVIGPSLEVWREGLVDVLARDFDGAGPLRTVSPSMVMRTFRGTADKATAGDLGRSTHAGLVVFGQLIESGHDSVRAMVTVLDVARDSSVADFEVRGAAVEMDRLADSIAVESLRQLGNTRSIAAVPRAFFGSRSLPALKVFLQGEQSYRRNDFAAAQVAYKRAIALDSGFVLGYHRMRGVLRGLASEFDSTSLWYAARAGAINRGTAPRDSMLILADSLAAVHRIVDPPYAGSDWLASLRRRVATLDDAARAYPEDPEVWTELGEVRAHYGERLGIDDRKTLDAFERALSIDSTYGPAFFHAIDLTMRLRGPKVALPIVQRYMRVNPHDTAFILIAGVMNGASNEHLIRDLDRVINDSVAPKLQMLARFADDHDAAAALYARRLTLDTTAADSVREHLLLMRRAMFRGRLRDAYVNSDSNTLRGGTGGAGIALALAEYGVMPASAASALFASSMRPGDLAALPFAFPWWQRHGDSASLQAAIGMAVKAERQDAPATRGLARYAELSARSYLSLARGDTASALRGFLALADSSMPRFLAPLRVDVARLLLATGKPREAAAYLDLRPPYPVTSSIWDVEWRAVRARAARQLGDTQRARDCYAAVAAAWANADRELQPAVAEARDALRQLGSAVAN